MWARCEESGPLVAFAAASGNGLPHLLELCMCLHAPELVSCACALHAAAWDLRASECRVPCAQLLIYIECPLGAGPHNDKAESNDPFCCCS